MTLMPRRLSALDWLFLVASLCMAALFSRLGVWQLHRLAERRARNALVMRRLALPTLAVADLPRDTASAHYHTVHVVGRYDVDHEVVFVNRIRDGAPGVQILTPLWAVGRDTAVLIDRGWVYAPDAETVDLARWREPAELDATGYVQELPPPVGRGVAALIGHPNQLRWLDLAAVARVTGYPVAPFFIVLEGDTAGDARTVPVRVEPPPLDEGPHMSYAIQWFAFATIAVVGAGIAVFGVERKPGAGQ